MPTPVRRASAAANLRSSHQGSVNATRPCVGEFGSDAAHGVQTSAMPKTVASPMPASRKASRSRVMPSFVTLQPIQCHQTPGLASNGGWWKTVSGSSAAKSPADTATATAAKRDEILILFRLVRIFEDERIDEHDGKGDRGDDKRSAKRNLRQLEIRVPIGGEAGNERAPDARRVPDDVGHPRRDDRTAENRHDEPRRAELERLRIE